MNPPDTYGAIQALKQTMARSKQLCDEIASYRRQIEANAAGASVARLVTSAANDGRRLAPLPAQTPEMTFAIEGLRDTIAVSRKLGLEVATLIRGRSYNRRQASRRQPANSVPFSWWHPPEIDEDSDGAARNG